MSPKAWVRLDNASNIFLAARSDVDPKVFRMSAELHDDVDPEVLQRALDETYDRYPLYHAVLRPGVFWYFLQESSLRPVVTAEDQPSCAPIYRPGRRTLLFRVMHHRRRIILEVFHALSDGTGALWFLSDLVAAYVRLSLAGPVPEADAPSSPVPEPAHTLAIDSFTRYFRRRRRRDSPPDSVFAAEAAPAPLTVGEDSDPPPEAARRRRRPTTRVHRVRGTRTPDNRTRAVELTMPARAVLDLAREHGTSPTMFLTALFLEAVRLSSGDLGRARTLAASVPVNLRQFFPSTSARNFFATIRVWHTYGEGPDDLASICRGLEEQFRPRATPKALEKKLRRLIRFERSPALRVLPRPVKDVILGVVNWFSNRGLTVAISNMGRVVLPEPAPAHVGRVLFHVSAARPQFCAITHAGQLAVTFTSPFTETGHVREFARLLTSRGVPVTVAAARATEAEFEEVPA